MCEHSGMKAEDVVQFVILVTNESSVNLCNLQNPSGLQHAVQR